MTEQLTTSESAQAKITISRNRARLATYKAVKTGRMMRPECCQLCSKQSRRLVFSCINLR